MLAFDKETIPDPDHYLGISTISQYQISSLSKLQNVSLISGTLRNIIKCKIKIA